MTTVDAMLPRMQGPDPAGFRVVRVDDALRSAAASRLVASAAGNDRNAGKRFLTAAAQHSISLKHFWASVGGPRNQVREVCLAVPGAGRTAMFFTSNPQSLDGQAELATVISTTCADLPVSKLAQALLEPAEPGARGALLGAGFRILDELLYMRRPRPAPGEFPASATAAAGLPKEISLHSWAQGDDPDLVAALEHTYINTLDCPELCGMRTATDVLDSHRSTGKWNPAYWWIIRSSGAPRGAMLFNPCPDQSSIELVYFGLGPELRGRGLASALLSIGLGELSERKETAITCAVDARNKPARRLYENLGFSEFGRRAALVKPLRPE